MVRKSLYYFQPIVTRMLLQTASKRSIWLSQPGTSLFIQPMTVVISLWISSTRFRFQQMDSLWNTRLRNVRNVFSGADTFFLFRSFLGMKGNALRRSFQSRRSYSLLSNYTQNPRVSSATIFDGVMLSCLPAICLLACVI